MAASLSFYGGVGEVGGNKILLEDGPSSGRARLLFDFGISFRQRARFFEEFLNPRPGAGLLDVLEMGLLPPLEGLYRDDLVADAGIWQRFRARPGYRRLPAVDAVLLSHAHVDHSGYISFLRPDIPIYASTMTAFIAKAMEDTSPTNIEKEICYVNPRELEDGYLRTVRGAGYRQRPFVFVDGPVAGDTARAFWDWSPAKTKRMDVAPTDALPQRVGGLKLRHFAVDHSIFGATAYAVETSSGWVAYTGDLRLHGSGAAKTERAIEGLAALRPRVLLCEGSRAGDERKTTEEEVYQNALRAVREAKGLVVADFGPRNVERLLCFHRIAQETGRNLVILAQDAYLLDAMRLASDEVPDIALSNDILIFDDLRLREERWRDEMRRCHASKFVGPKDVSDSPGDFILCFSFWDVKHLIDIAPQGGLYLYSSSEVYDEEQAIDMQRLRNWIGHFGMKPLGLPVEAPSGKWEVPEGQQGLHASGHASGPELLEMIKQIQPQTLIPIHTERPEYFAAVLQGSGIQVLVPEYGHNIPLG